MTPPAGGERVELFGIGGAGKSTLLDRLLETRAGGRLHVGRPPAPSPWQVRVARLRWATELLMAASAAVLRPSEHPGVRELNRKIAYRLAGYRHWDRRDASPHVLADAGFLEPFVTRTMYFGADERLPMAGMLSRLPRPSVAIYVDCQVDVAFDRFVRRERELERLHVAPALPELRENFSAARSTCDQIARWTSGRGTVVFDVDGTKSLNDMEIDELVVEVLKFV